MEDRGAGISVKAEDELVELKNKLNNFYVQKEPFLEVEVKEGCLSMPLFRNKFNMISSIHIGSCEKDRDYVVFDGMNPNGYHFNKHTMPLKTNTEEIYSMFENTYKFEKEESDGIEHWIRYELRMKDGSKFTNDECFRLIENIFNMVTDKPGFVKLFIPRLRESVWSDMEDRGTGDKVKIEDIKLGNLNDIEPVDLGQPGVVWADRDFEMDGKYFFTFAEAKDIESKISGWRLPRVGGTDRYLCDMVWHHSSSGATACRVNMNGQTLEFMYRGMEKKGSLCHEKDYCFWADKGEQTRGSIEVVNYDDTVGLDCVFSGEEDTTKCCIRFVRDK